MQNNIPNKTNDQVYAGFFVRFAAYLIDWLIVGTALLVVRIPFWIASIGGATGFAVKDFIFDYSIYDIFIYVLKVGYFVLMTYFTGATLGKKLLQIRVISEENRKPTFFEILFRESVGKFLSGLILYVGYIMIGADKQKRGLHDILSDTKVVYYHQKAVAVPTPIMYQQTNYPYNPMTNVPQQGSQMPNMTQPTGSAGQMPSSSQQPTGSASQIQSTSQQPNEYQQPGNFQVMQDIQMRYKQQPYQAMQPDRQNGNSQPEQPVQSVSANQPVQGNAQEVSENKTEE